MAEKKGNKNSFVTHSAAQTKKFAREFLKKMSDESALRKGASVIGLLGNLGAGKTTFSQGFAKGLGVKEKITSPTFVILKKFRIQNTSLREIPQSGTRYKSFYHIDAYRLQNAKELVELGWEEIIKNPENIIVVEWAERIKKILPQNVAFIRFAYAGKSGRAITIEK